MKDLATSPDPYLSYVDYNCGNEGLKFNLKAKISVNKKDSLPAYFNVKNVDIFLNFSDFALPSEDENYQCQILYAAFSETNQVLVDLGELKYHLMQKFLHYYQVLLWFLQETEMLKCPTCLSKCYMRLGLKKGPQASIIMVIGAFLTTPKYIRVCTTT